MQTANKFLMGEERKVEFSMYQNKGKKKKEIQHKNHVSGWRIKFAFVLI